MCRSSLVPSGMFPATGAITTTMVINGKPVGADVATGNLPWLVVDHIKHEFVLFGQIINFRQFKPCCLRVLLALCNWPSQKVLDDDLFKEARLRGKVSNLAAYISRGLRPILRPIVEKYGPQAGIDDLDAIKYGLIVNVRKEYQNVHDRTRYYLAIPPEKVRHIHSPAAPRTRECRLTWADAQAVPGSNRKSIGFKESFKDSF